MPNNEGIVVACIFTAVVVRWGLFVVAEADLVVTVVIEGLAVAANAVMNSC